MHVSAGGSGSSPPGPSCWCALASGTATRARNRSTSYNVYVAADVLRRHLRWFAQGPAARGVLWPSMARASPSTVQRGAAGLEGSQRWVDALLERQQGVVRLSPGHLSRLFALHLGSPPLEHHARLRTERAASLLIETELAVSEIGRIVGWADPSCMSRRFRRVHGMSPALYRRTSCAGT